MGIMNGRDLFAPKWITAQITDHSNRLWFVPIKHTIGNWFLAKIDRSLYVFEIDARAIRTYYATGVRTLRFLFYDVSSCQPLQPDQVDYLRRFMDENKIAKVDGTMVKLLRSLKRVETPTTTAHDLTALLEQLQKMDQNTETASLITFLSELDNTQVSAPVEPVSSFLDNELITTKPSFLGNLFTQYRALDAVHQKVTNKTAGGGMSWLKLGIVFMMIMAVAVFAYIGTEEGWFDFESLDLGLGGAFAPTTGSDDQSDPGYWTSRYSPQQLIEMVNNGTLYEDDLPKEIQDILDNVRRRDG